MRLVVLGLLLITMVFCKILRQLQVCVFYFSFIQQMITFKLLCLLLHQLKSFFYSRDTQIFVFMTSSHPPPPLVIA